MENTGLNIRLIGEDDWPAVQLIYRQGIATGMATFETEVPEWVLWNSSHLSHSRLVAEKQHEILGWAALSPVSDRCVYGGVAEVSIYVIESARGEGVGSKLLEALIRKSEENGIWTLQAATFVENNRSVRLHKKGGFRIVGKREKLGCLCGIWKDVVLLERRSRKVGID